MKYMVKQFGTETEPLTKGDLLFNAVVWKTKTRMWGTSKELTAVMKRPDKDSDVIWIPLNCSYRAHNSRSGLVMMERHSRISILNQT